MTPPSTIRMLSCTERLWLLADTPDSSFDITFVIEGNGDRCADLQRAIELAAGHNPGARATLRRPRFGKPSWQDSGHGPRVEEVASAPLPGPRSSRKKLAANDHGLSVQLAPGPTIIFHAHHALMDGRGLWHFVEEVFRAWRGEPLRGGEDHLTDIALCHDEGASAPMPKPAEFLAPTGPASRATGWRWDSRRAQGSWDRFLPRVAMAVAARVWDIEQDAPVRFYVPMDLRPRHERASTANLTGVLSLEFDRHATLDTIQRSLQDARQRGEAESWIRRVQKLDRLPSGLLWLATAMKKRRQQRAPRYGQTATLSNLGRVDLASCEAPGFSPSRIYWIPPAGSSASTFIGLISAGGFTEITTVMPTSQADEGRLEEFLDAIVEALHHDENGAPL